MEIQLMLDWKWNSQIRSPLLANQSTLQNQYSPSTSVRGREASYELTRTLIPSVTPEDNLALCKDPSKTYTSSFAVLPVMEKEMKLNLGKGVHRALYDQIDDIRLPVRDYTSISCQSLHEKEKSRFNLLYKNLEKIEEIFLDEDLVTLERDIFIQLGKLGALQLFHMCLSRTLRTPSTISYSTQLIKHPKDFLMEGEIDNQVGNIIIGSGKKKERKSRREKISAKAALSTSSRTIYKIPPRAIESTVENSSKPRSRRHNVYKNEAEMSMRVKDVADLERIRTKLEVQSGQVASFKSWAKAVGIEEKVLQQRLCYGWICRDKLLRSTHSLVAYLARNYRGLGISLEDLYQAGKVGVLKGAERFDHKRGYQFSTYVQYWIRREMSALVEQHSREIHIPVTLSRRISKIKKARKTLYNLHGRYPDDEEIARFCGLSLAKLRFASECPVIVGSFNQRMEDNYKEKLADLMPDRSTKTPEELVMRKHMQKDVSELLQGLLPRESRVLLLRYGFGDGRSKSLEEIARIFKCTKEWIRKVEKSALMKLRKEKVLLNLNQYVDLLH